MEWSKVNFDWNRARAFLVTADEGSFSAAARALKTAQPTIGRQVAALEKELSVVLFERVGRSLVLTPTGEDVAEHIRAMAEAATRVSLVAAGQSLSLDGTICISASEMTATFVLPAIIREIRAIHPGIEFEVVATNEASDLRRREADIAIRSFRPTQESLVARKVAEGRARLYAAQSYLDSIGNPTKPEDLSKAAFIGFNRGGRLMTGLNERGLNLTEANFPIVSQTQIVQWQLVKQGLGIAIMLEEVGEIEPGVVRALEDFPPITVPIWLVCHRELRTSRRVRVVFDLLADALSPESRQ